MALTLLSPTSHAPQTFPALFSLFRLSLLPKNSRIIGYARTKMNDDEFHGKFKDNLKDGSDEEKKKFLDICNYVPGAYDQDDAFQNLNKEIEKKEKDIGAKEPNREQPAVAAKMIMVQPLTLDTALRRQASSTWRCRPTSLPSSQQASRRIATLRRATTASSSRSHSARTSRAAKR